MFILNKKSNLIQECSNQDVIKICKKDSNGFRVANTKEELLSEEPQNEAQNEPNLNEKEEAKELSGETEKAENEANTEAQEVSESNEEAEDNSESEENEDQEDDQAKYEAMNVNELRAVAKEKKIQGYGNMNKATLIAVIMAH